MTDVRTNPLLFSFIAATGAQTVRYGAPPADTCSASPAVGLEVKRKTAANAIVATSVCMSRLVARHAVSRVDQHGTRCAIAKIPRIVRTTATA